MRTRYAWLFVGLMACTKAGSNQETAAPPEPVPVQAKPPAPPPPPPITVAKVTVQMTAATLTDDCGSTSAPSPKAKAKSESFAKEDRACDQSSMQLSVKATAGGAKAQLTVKSVELFDDKGAKIGSLTASSPTVWGADGTYAAWDQNIAAGTELSVSYVLSSPAWGSIADRRNHTYVLEAVVTIDGADQTVKRDVSVAAPTSLPPGVKT